MKRFLIIIPLLLFIFSGCGEETETDVQVPEDFNFSFIYGVEGGNEINTYNGYIIKDLVSNGRADSSFALTSEDRQSIYNKIVKFKLNELTESIIDEKLQAEPSSNYIFTYTANGVEKTITGDESTFEMKGKDAENYSQFIEFLTNLISETSEYKAFPTG